MVTTEYLLSRRDDLSEYLVHLTRKYNGDEARDNLDRILKKGIIHARNPYCLFLSEIKKLGPSLSKSFNVVCFTETPLNGLAYITQRMEKRNIELSQYGLVFKRDVIQRAGGNSVFYLDTRSESGKERCRALWECYRLVESLGFKQHPFCSFLPLINKIGDYNDFSWEREWRIIGNFRFEQSDVFLGLAKKDRIAEYEKRFPDIPWISPRWGRDQIVSKLRELVNP